MNAYLSEIACALGLESDAKTPIDTLLTDSRSLSHPETSLFFAINTPGGNNGHDYMRQLYDMGVRAFVAQYVPEDMKDCKDASILITEDSVAALHTVAAIARKTTAHRVAIRAVGGQLGNGPRLRTRRRERQSRPKGRQINIPEH